MDFMEIHCTSLTSKQEDGTSAPGLVAKRKGSQHSFFFHFASYDGDMCVYICCYLFQSLEFLVIVKTSVQLILSKAYEKCKHRSSELHADR